MLKRIKDIIQNYQLEKAKERINIFDLLAFRHYEDLKSKNKNKQNKNKG